MKKSVLLAIMLFSCVIAFSQWTTKTDLTGVGKNHPVTFTINGKGYVFTGYNYDLNRVYADGYIYDPETDLWTQLSNFPGGARGLAVGAAYNGKGYLGFGVANSYFDDLWEYDPVNDSWKELASCPCMPRRHPAFTITTNGKIQVGLGNQSNANPDFKDWWEYDIASNTWTEQTDLPGDGRHHPYYFSIGTDAYVGFGDNHFQRFKDFYKFDSQTGVWTDLSPFPGEARVAGAQFAHNGYGYIVDGEGQDHRNLEDGELYRYDPASDTWTTLASHVGDGLWAPGAFVIDDMAYVVGGDDNSNVSHTTLWAFSLEETPIDNALTTDNNTLTISSDFFDQDAAFQWVDCSNNYEPMPGETSTSIKVPEGASYALVVTYFAGGVDTSACYDYAPISTAIEPIDNDNVFSVFPNPAKDWVHIQGKGEFEDFEYIIVNSLGKELEKGNFVGRSDIDFRNLVNGMYFLHVKSEDGNTERVLKIEKTE